MPGWLWGFLLIDIIGALLISLAIAWKSPARSFWRTSLSLFVGLGLVFVGGTYLIYQGGWWIVVALRGG